MATYVILSRISPEAFRKPEDFRKLAKEVGDRIRSECPGVVWKDSYGLFGRFDILDIVEADDPKDVTKAATIIRAFGHSSTETMLATPWKEFIGSM
ncbi:MAG: GYD family protein [candidate division Zixibacteria bacterium SM23_81]|nr:MAG: GYD family protein [candidate division Zixibacteria bacterium SM23_81]